MILDRFYGPYLDSRPWNRYHRQLEVPECCSAAAAAAVAAGCCSAAAAAAGDVRRTVPAAARRGSHFEVPSSSPVP